MHDITGVAAYVIVGALLPHVLKLLYRLIARPSVYADDLDALALNVNPPETRWFNMGYWNAGCTSFPEAAAELCRRVAINARLKTGARVLELGSGYGDSARLLAEEFQLGSYLGVTAEAGQQRFAVQAAQKADLKNVAYVAGDAVAQCASLAVGSFDSVLAIDCAYHFDTRNRMLQHAHRVLIDDGTLAMSDLLLPDRPLALYESIALRFICLLAGLPWSNLTKRQAYIAQLEAAGFTDVVVEDMSAHTYPGFLAFVERHGESVGRGLTAWDGLRKYASIVKWYSNPERPRLTFCLASARAKKERLSSDR